MKHTIPLLVTLLLVPLAALHGAAPPARPNVVYIVADDLGYARSPRRAFYEWLRDGAVLRGLARGVDDGALPDSLRF